MKISIITSSKLPQGAKEDQPLFTALQQQNIDFDICIWDKPTEWQKYTVCLMRTVWDYHEKIHDFNQWLNLVSTRTKVLNRADIIKWNQNKLYLKELADFGITIAPTVWLNKSKLIDYDKVFNALTSEWAFLKPVIGADSAGTLRFKNDPKGIAMAQKHLSNWLNRYDMMLQPYLKTVETFGETSVIYINGQFTHGIRKIPQSGDYRVQDTFGASDVVYEPNAAELSLSKACLQYITHKFELPLYARFDFLHDERGAVYLNEAELLEPSLFFHHCPIAATNMAQALATYCSYSVIT
ncbi:MAG: hypothetical protein KDI92_09120 [Xanthomonadales bacterium]|nr:hypothetical protein [Xanthomonadales bacterium]